MTSSYGYGVLEQALAVSAFAVGPWTTAADQCDANYYADGRSAAVQQRQRDHSGALHHRRSQRCQLAALQPDHWRLPRNDGAVAARRPPPHCQQRCGQAALAAALPTSHSCAPSGAAQQAALCALLRHPQRRGRTGAASGAAPEPAAPRGSASDHVALPRGTHAPKSRENRGTSATARARVHGVFALLLLAATPSPPPITDCC
jgi:hypothetical protein